MRDFGSKKRFIKKIPTSGGQPAYKLTLPHTFVNQHMLMLVDRELELSPSADAAEIWIGSVSPRRNKERCEYTLHGWKMYAEGNGIKAGDQVCFDLISPQRMVIQVIRSADSIASCRHQSLSPRKSQKQDGLSSPGSSPGSSPNSTQQLTSEHTTNNEVEHPDCGHAYCTRLSLQLTLATTESEPSLPRLLRTAVHLSCRTQYSSTYGALRMVQITQEAPGVGPWTGARLECEASPRPSWSTLQAPAALRAMPPRAAQASLQASPLPVAQSIPLEGQVIARPAPVQVPPNGKMSQQLTNAGNSHCSDMSEIKAQQLACGSLLKPIVTTLPFPTASVSDRKHQDLASPSIIPEDPHSVLDMSGATQKLLCPRPIAPNLDSSIGSPTSTNTPFQQQARSGAPSPSFHVKQQLEASLKRQSLDVLRAAAQIEVMSSTLAAPNLLSSMEAPAAGTMLSIHADLNTALVALKSSLWELLRVATSCVQQDTGL